MGYESIAHETEGRIGYWLRGYEGYWLRGYEGIFRKLKLDINPFLPPKHYKYGERFSLLVGCN